MGANNDAGSALYNPRNEPSFATSFLYNYVPRMQWKTVNQSRATVDAYYSGALPSWLIWNLIGLYPVTSQPICVLSAPLFSSLKIKLFDVGPFATELKILAPGLSTSDYYPQSVTLNGQKLNTSWISHSQLPEGGSLVFEMGAEPGN